MAAFRAELQKAHRRHDLALCLLIPGIVVLWVGGLAPADPEELANGYSALLYSLPVIEAILMPVMMAVLASRLWDMEIKGNTAKLLYTLQSRRSLFAGKAVFGVLEVLLVTVLELACVPVLGRVHSYTEAFPTGQLVYLFVCTLAVDTMLFFGEFLLMLVGRQSPAGALRGHCRGAGGAVLCFYAAACQLFCALWVLHSSERLRSGELGPGHPHRHLRHPPLQLGAAGFHPCAGRCAVCPCVAQGTGRGGIKPC